MATYTLISSNVLASSAASVTFSAIPATFTDLVVRISARGDAAGSRDFLYLQFNTDSAGSNYSYTDVVGSGAAATSGGGGSLSPDRMGQLVGNSATASTFGNTEIYIPSYTVSQSKPVGTFSVTENNATTAYVSSYAYLWRNNATINQLVFTTANAANFVSGSSFYLYGISNA
jgi:hypothetical protein